MIRSLKRLFYFCIVLLLTLTAFFYVAEDYLVVHLPEPGEDAYLYSNQTHNDLTRTYLSSIEKAKKSILLMIYNISDPSIINSLRTKSEEGVDVIVITDANASFQVKRFLGKKVRVYSRNDKGLMHLKILVVDEELVVMGSANLSRHSLRIHTNLVMAFNSKAVAHFISNRAKEVAIGEPSLINTSAIFTLGNQQLEFWFLPSDKTAVNRIIQLLDQAKKTINVALFTWTRQDFAQALLRARLRGVKVEAIIDRGTSNNASKKIARFLYREKVPLFINTSQGLLHHKFCLIDEEILINGSANWTKAAFTLNNDCFVILSPLNKEQKSKLNSMWHSLITESVSFKPR